MRRSKVSFQCISTYIISLSICIAIHIIHTCMCICENEKARMYTYRYDVYSCSMYTHICDVYSRIYTYILYV